jgi:hypothetical protein
MASFAASHVLALSGHLQEANQQCVKGVLSYRQHKHSVHHYINITMNCTGKGIHYTPIQMKKQPTTTALNELLHCLQLKNYYECCYCCLLLPTYHSYHIYFSYAVLIID